MKADQPGIEPATCNSQVQRPTAEPPHNTTQVSELLRRMKTAIVTMLGSDYIVPRTKTKLGDRAFSVAGPTVLNSLPESVRSAETLSTFKRKLKTYLLNISL